VLHVQRYVGEHKHSMHHVPASHEIAVCVCTSVRQVAYENDPKNAYALGEDAQQTNKPSHDLHHRRDRGEI